MEPPYGLVAINLNFGRFYDDPPAILDHIAQARSCPASLAPTLYHITILWYYRQLPAPSNHDETLTS